MCDICVKCLQQILVNRGILMLPQQGFPYKIGARAGVDAAFFQPVGIVVLVGQKRRVKRGFIAGPGMCGPEKVPSRSCLADRIRRKGRVVHNKGGKVGIHHLERFGVQDQLFKAGIQPAQWFRRCAPPIIAPQIAV
jgi:hypothetical protein